MIERVVLTLYIAGRSARSERALQSVDEMRERAPGFEIEVVDVLQHPERAEAARIVATPVLVKVSPPPARRVIGDLGDVAAVARVLDLRTGAEGAAR